MNGVLPYRMSSNFNQRVIAEFRANGADLHNHHTGEDVAMFPLLAEQRPELASALDRLRREHERIAGLLAELQDVVSGPTDPALVLGEVERLTDELERHLTYEEEQLIPVLEAAPS
jgi:iron-sulfur cluster repair protein YtfE (RIC family)